MHFPLLLEGYVTYLSWCREGLGPVGRAGGLGLWFGNYSSLIFTQLTWSLSFSGPHDRNAILIPVYSVQFCCVLLFRRGAATLVTDGSSRSVQRLLVLLKEGGAAPLRCWRHVGSRGV